MRVEIRRISRREILIFGLRRIFLRPREGGGCKPKKEKKWGRVPWPEYTPMAGTV